MMEVKETLFFALFKTSETIHDRMTLMQGDRTLQDFFDWVKQEREKIETDRKQPVAMHSFKIERY